MDTSDSIPSNVELRLFGKVLREHTPSTAMKTCCEHSDYRFASDRIYDSKQHASAAYFYGIPRYNLIISNHRVVVLEDSKKSGTVATNVDNTTLITLALLCGAGYYYFSK
jgi:hypothetical protein